MLKITELEEEKFGLSVVVVLDTSYLEMASKFVRTGRGLWNHPTRLNFHSFKGH